VPDGEAGQRPQCAADEVTGELCEEGAAPEQLLADGVDRRDADHDGGDVAVDQLAVRQEFGADGAGDWEGQ
jgi:hypothetical protein